MNINTPALAVAFAAELELQARNQRRTVTPLNKATADAFFTEALKTIADEDINTSFKALPAETGAGKSMSAIAFIAAAFKLLPDFTAAYLVETMRQAEEVRQEIAALIGDDNVTCWTYGHDVWRDEAYVFAKNGFLPETTTTKSALKYARIIVTTHKQWKKEVTSRQQLGVRHFVSKAARKSIRRRSIIVIDEAPSLVEPIKCVPNDITLLRDRVFITDGRHPLVPALDRVVSRMNDLFTSEGQHFSLADIVSPEDEVLLRSVATLREVWKFVDQETDEEDTQKGQAASMVQAAKFIAAAARGYAFFHRDPPMFIGYSTAFRSGPGHIVLDGTADVGGFTKNMRAKSIDVPRVDYCNLTAVHLEHPRRFKYVTRVVELADTAEPYAEWIKSTVLANTSPGEEVLIVVHDGLLKHKYIPRAENPAEPWLLEGRRINVLHWGVGVGSNKYGHKSTVFLFGEHFMPKRETFVATNFYEKWRVTADNVRSINGPTLTGRYREVSDGHLLRWFRQLAGRGAIRNIDANGVAAPMKLFMSGDFDRVIGAWSSLFPNARAPKLLRGRPQTTEEATKVFKGTDGLVRLLASTSSDELTSDAVVAFTGIDGTNISRAVKNSKVRAAMNAYGWTYEPGLGRGRRGRFFKSDQGALAA